MRLRKADLNVLSKLGDQGLEWRLEPEALTGDEVGREDDLLDFLVAGRYPGGAAAIAVSVHWRFRCRPFAMRHKRRRTRSKHPRPI